MKTLTLLLTILLTPLFAQIPQSNRHEGEAAADRAAAWLLASQHEDGHWSSPQWPALTALAVWALSLNDATRDSDAVRRGVDYILSTAHPDGSIFVKPDETRRGGGLSNYNTAIAMVALYLSGVEEARPYVLRARRFVAGAQHLGGDVYHGGFGYDSNTGRAYADLSNTFIAIEGMRLTEDIEDFRTDGERVDFDREAAVEFISAIQNRSESNPADWVSDHPEDAGGFAYRPDDSRGLVRQTADGKEAFRTFGSMTYAGMLSLIYADVDRNDPRVRSAFEWSTRNWTVTENMPADQEGYYYFINVLTKAMATFGQDIFTRENGEEVNWRVDVINELVRRQRIDANGNGFWLNDDNRYWEGDPVLVTAYALIALQVALGE
ncbi:MAG: terpene cyclase/mutase family protein [Verrucomicrobia bacterium]|nr:terpene cyclase/mutase family protein [Verrucomicrobiota bacterium]MCH8526493.1 terpene cyclase/mutase family protein [Kiritimatiellia bacterium]